MISFTMKKILIFSFMILVGFGCKKDQTESMNEQLKGQWVRIDIRSDTLLFGYWSNNWVELRRGYKMIDGNNTPIAPCGLFEYSITNDNINLNWIASSTLSTKKYLFKLYNSKMNIGNFIESSNAILTFEKIK